MSDNDFSVEHTGVRKRQREGTLERVVTYDEEALDKAWAWMASSPSDRTTNRKKKFRHFLSPGKGAKDGQFWAD